MTWQAATIVALVIALAIGFGWYERSRPPSRVLALVAALAALAVVGRLAFAPLPNVKPATTDVILFAGFALGAAPGFATGAIAAFVSNFFFEQGAWTPWQMAAWAMVGVGGGVLARVAGRDLGRWPLAIACGFAGLAFGAVMDTYQWTLAARQDLGTWIAVSGSSLPFNLAHAIGNFLFCLALGPAFVRSLQRFRRRFDFTWARPATVAGALALALVAAAALGVPRAEASTASRALSYLRASQNNDGGFGAARGAGSTQLHTAWAALGMAAAGHSPNEAGSKGRSAITYMRTHAASLNDVGELERTILALHAGAVSPRKFAGRDLVDELLARQRGDGSFAGLVNQTAFGILAMRAGGVGGGALSSATSWLAAHQADDGGFGFTPGAAGDVDDTGAALQALAAGGRSGESVKRAVGFLRKAQRPDGGFGQYPQSSSNAQSTAWAVQGLVAVRRDVDSFSRGGDTPLSYIRSLSTGDGSIRYSRSSSQTPVWVTAQALAALELRAFPLTRVEPRRAGMSGGGSKGGSGYEKKKQGKRKGSGAAAATGARAGTGVAGRRVQAVRRTSGGVLGSDDSGPSPALILLGSGAALLLLAGGVHWRSRRLARRVL